MAPSIRSKTTDTFAATASPVTTYPSVVAGDPLFACFVSDTATNYTGTPPTGWTLLAEVDFGTRTAAIFTATATGSESGTLTWTSIMSSATTGNAIMFSIQNGFNGSFLAGSGTETTTSGSAKDTASVTPSAADCLALGLLGHSANRTFTWDAGITEEFDSNTSPTGGNNPGWFVGSKVLTGTPATSLGGDVDGAASTATAEYIVFVKPASGLSAALTAATETDTAQPLGRAKSLPLGVASESNTAQGVGRIHTRVLGIASESDTALPVGVGIFTRPLGVASESDTALVFVLLSSGSSLVPLGERVRGRGRIPLLP